jgi:hypothetical protein
VLPLKFKNGNNSNNLLSGLNDHLVDFKFLSGTFQDLFFDWTHCHNTKHTHFALLPDAMSAIFGLQIGLRILHHTHTQHQNVWDPNPIASHKQQYSPNPNRKGSQYQRLEGSNPSHQLCHKTRARMHECFVFE